MSGQGGSSRDWNPGLYSRFEAERTRPARDLLAAVPLDHVAAAVDLGCGPGNSTAILAARYPEAAVTGIDTSDAMLAEARTRLPEARFERADIATWQPSGPVDLLFANASLQWVPGHETLLPRLLGCLAPGGVLALQVPDNADEPTHRLMREVAATDRWQRRIGPEAARRLKVLDSLAIYDLLAPLSASVDIWRTTYQHPMADADALVSWVSATGLRPCLDPLDDGERQAFRAEYRERLAKAYPPRADGQVLLAFPRLFVVARR